MIDEKTGGLVDLFIADINDCKNNSCPGRECFDLVNGYICSCSGNSNGEHCVKGNAW